MVWWHLKTLLYPYTGKVAFLYWNGPQGNMRYEINIMPKSVIGVAIGNSRHDSDFVDKRYHHHNGFKYKLSRSLELLKIATILKNIYHLPNKLLTLEYTVTHNFCSLIFSMVLNI